MSITKYALRLKGTDKYYRSYKNRSYHQKAWGSLELATLWNKKHHARSIPSHCEDMNRDILEIVAIKLKVMHTEKL